MVAYGLGAAVFHTKVRAAVDWPLLLNPNPTVSNPIPCLLLLDSRDESLSLTSCVFARCHALHGNVTFLPNTGSEQLETIRLTRSCMSTDAWDVKTRELAFG